jgi:hypothetical protein
MEMTTVLSQASSEKLIELFSEYYKDMTDEFMKDRTRTEAIKEFEEDLKSSGYDGDDNFEHMLWFLKGMNIPKPEPLKRYVESDEFKVRKFNERMMKQIREKRIRQDLSHIPTRFRVQPEMEQIRNFNEQHGYIKPIFADDVIMITEPEDEAGFRTCLQNKPYREEMFDQPLENEPTRVVYINSCTD